MKRSIYFLGLWVFILLSCQGGSAPTADSAKSSDALTTETTIPNSDVSGTTPTTVPSAIATDQTPATSVLSDNFPVDQKVALTADVLGALCQNKYGCVQEIIYPLGWSADGKFAYLIAEANEAVVDYTLHFIIQDTESDEQLEKNTYQASEQAGYNPDRSEEDLASVWAARKSTYEDLLNKHNIQLGNGTEFITLPTIKAQEPYRFKSLNKMAHNDLFDLDFVAEHRLEASEQGVGKKIILKHTFGKYDLALATQPLGYFRSPFADKVAVLDAFENRGYEGPPNVLKLLVVGCDLAQGFK